MSFIRSVADPCAYVKHHEDGDMYLTVHVDDMLLVSPTERSRRIFEVNLEEQFEITKQLNDLSYLGMTIKKTADGIRAHQAGYIDQMINKFGADPDSRVTSPTGTDFLETDSEDEEVNKTKYLSLIMSLMFLARFTRIDVLMPVTF
jgi:hypothetical protein